MTTIPWLAPAPWDIRCRGGRPGAESEPITDSQLYWWHQSVIREMERLRDECCTTEVRLEAVVLNMTYSQFLKMDTRRYIDQLIDAGKLVELEADADGWRIIRLS